MATRRLGIVVGGGPAPGINAVIGAATIEAINQGFEVIGFFDGFKNLVSDKFDASQHAVRLLIPMVARIHFDGGSILRTSRTNLMDASRIGEDERVAPDPEKVTRVLGNLQQTGVDALLTIGGDDTSLSGRFIHEAASGGISVVHCPKTIDNDLPLPHGVTTFGFTTARFIGTNLTKNLMRDSQTTGRWYFVSAMGRTAGWLAQQIAQAAGATVSLIPEEFEESSTVAQVADVLEAAMLKRRVRGRTDGVAVIAEGCTYKLGNREEIERILGRSVPVDSFGHMRLAEVPLVEILKKEVQQRFADRGEKIGIVSHTLGYELRSADPTPHDMRYCRALGWGAIQIMLDEKDGRPGKMVTMVNDNIVPVDFHELIDPETNRTRVRLVDIDSDNYRVARAYQIRLEQTDLDDPEMLGRLAAEAKITPEEFKTKYRRAATPLHKMPAEMRNS